MQKSEECAETLESSPVLAGRQVAPVLNRRLIWIMALACGLTAANIYYSQPLLVEIARSFGATESSAGIIATVTQLGFALGLLLLVPLGDMFSRRRLISCAMVAVVLGLVAIALAPSLAVLAVASLALGVAMGGPRMMVPFAAGLGRPGGGGGVVGAVMGGLLIGFLRAGGVSGFVGASLGGRGLSWFAPALMALLLVPLFLPLP